MGDGTGARARVPSGFRVSGFGLKGPNLHALKEHSPESHGQHLALTALCVPYSLCICSESFGRRVTGSGRRALNLAFRGSGFGERETLPLVGEEVRGGEAGCEAVRLSGSCGRFGSPPVIAMPAWCPRVRCLVSEVPLYEPLQH